MRFEILAKPLMFGINTLMLTLKLVLIIKIKIIKFYEKKKSEIL